MLPVARRLALAAMLAAGAPALAADAHGSAPWGYRGQGGPEHWGDLAAANEACTAGDQQSPIDLVGAVPAAIAPPRIAWKTAAAAAITDNGHTWQVDLVDAGGLTHGATAYALKQIHFHHDAEHTVAGVRHPLEAHFVHQSEAGDLAVVAVFFEAGEPNAALDQLWAHAPPPGESQALEGLDPTAFLPAGDAQIHYAGSLTTPPCSEIVTWTVFTEPASASPEQIAAFAARYPANFRPLQARNRRFLLSTR